MSIFPSASRTRWLFCFAVISCFGSGLPALGDDAEAKHTPKKLVVEVKVIEVATTKLKNLGFDWAQLAPEGVQRESIDKLLQSASADQLVKFLEALRQNNLARVLAEPTIATLDGRPASFTAGGTHLDIVPIVMGNGRVHLEYRIKLEPQQPESSQSTKRETGVQSQRFLLDAAANLDLGKSCLLGRSKADVRSPDGKTTSEFETLVIARVDLLKTDSPFKAQGNPVKDGEYREVARLPQPRGPSNGDNRTATPQIILK